MTITDPYQFMPGQFKTQDKCDKLLIVIFASSNIFQINLQHKRCVTKIC